MKTIPIINLKGGVGKTITAINMAHILSDMGYRVLIVDNDKQANTSKLFGAHSYTLPSLAECADRKELPSSGSNSENGIQESGHHPSKHEPS